MGRLAREFEPLFAEMQRDIYVLCRLFNFEPTWQQRQALDLVMAETHLPLKERKKRISCASGQGPGKTTVTVIIAIWRCLQGVDRLTVVTAPTMRQCKDVWIAECRRLLEKADPVLKRIIHVFGTRVEFFGRKNWGIWTATSTKPENLQGLHDDGLTFIVDEASGVDRAIIETIKGTVTNHDSLFIMIGNPNTRDCAFFDCFNKDRAMWHTLVWNAEESPNVDPEQIRRMAEEFGRDSDQYRIRVLGEFPHNDPNCIIAMEDIEACTRTSMVACARMTDVLQLNKVIAYDFARYGGDENVVYRRSGLAVVEQAIFTHAEPVAAVDAGFKMQKMAAWQNGECWHVADAGGIGQGVLSRFHSANRNVHEFHNGGTACSRDYANKITEAWFNLARLFKRRCIHIPRDNRLIQQLTTRMYFTDEKSGKLFIESKEDYRERGHESPDRADALAMLFYDRLLASGQVASRQRTTHEIGDTTKRQR